MITKDTETVEAILSRAEMRWRDRSLALDWYHRDPLPGFGQLTAADLVDRGQGQAVLDYLDAADAGIHA